MCITYLSRDSCRNLICKNLGCGHPYLASGHTYPAAPSALSARVPGYLLNRYGSGPPRGGAGGRPVYQSRWWAFAAPSDEVADN